jgi:lipopolysaccharide/colanic/teichoic acid biosynthesis glycosyltransferase
MKRVFDFIASLILLVALAPLMIALALVIRLRMGAPVIFSQARPGLHGSLFRLYKFRTMSNAADDDGELLPDAERLTRFGRFLRASSLDEFPAIWNVLKGDMSLVGPRPLLVEYLPLYSAEQNRRHEVRPGITGWAQVNGRNRLSWKKKFEMDVWYVDNRSLFLDIKILVMTLVCVFQRRDISHEGHATMEKFRGNNP